jgi:hypothetical protein
LGIGALGYLGSWAFDFDHYCLTDLTVDSNDITVLVSGEQKRENNVYFTLSSTAVILHCGT